MDGMNFTRWKEKMKFILTAFKVYYVLEGPQMGVLTEEEQRKRDQDETPCRGYILSTLTDRLYNLYKPFKNLYIEIPEKLLVGDIITKLPSSWHNYRNKLIHTSEDFTLDQIQIHLRIEEETCIHKKNMNGASSSKVNYVDSGKNNKGNDKKRKGHIKRYCKNPKKKIHNSNKKDESANAVEQVDTTKITTMVFEMNIGMIQELHMASVTTTSDD
ncbi:hypothetical protein Tco_0824939 [Tanacetum coccineum]